MKEYESQETFICEDCHNVVYGEIGQKIIELLGGRQLISLVVVGSKLYGLDHEDSDLDLRGVFIPTKREMILGSFPNVIKYSSTGDKEKNSKDDVDIELWSIHKFFQEAKSGDTGAISMLNAPFNKVCSRHEIWDIIVENHRMFYSKNMAGLIGFVLTQTAKYCVKGDRLKAANEVKNFLSALDNDVKLKDVWHLLPKSKWQVKIKKDGNTFYSVCDRMIQDTANVKYAKSVILSIIKSYGKRAKIAYNNDGMDWKAISHAFRVASELSNLYEFGMIKYPLDDFERIKRMKMGELDFKTDVSPDLNSLMDKVYKMSEQSNFPENVNTEKIDDFLYGLVKNYIN